MQDLFNRFIPEKRIFRNREVLMPSYIPTKLPHREKEIDLLASVSAAALQGETPSNIFIYGKTGTGKTAVTKWVGKELAKAGNHLDKSVHFFYINCAIVDTKYGVLQNIANHFISQWSERIPFTGWPTEEVYSKLLEAADKAGGVTIITLDEIDKIKGDELLYNLSRINSDLTNAKVSVIGISNDLKFTEFLDPRVKSSLGEQSMIFSPYNAEQLKDILEQRAQMAFKDGVASLPIITLCAGIAAQEHGDARKALDLLRISAELAEREQSNTVSEANVRRAQSEIEMDRFAEVIRTLPMQSKLILFSIIVAEEAWRVHHSGKLTTGELYNVYNALCKKAKVNSLTPRRVTELISELDMLGIITAKLISKGRYGRTKEIRLGTDPEKARSLLSEDEVISGVKDFKPYTQLHF
ncbi:MAG TPA: ORC1-type DNA replication protein [Thermoplasmata archaeon]|nr:ORC1-type DNA replication protein [Thermoplasmata archaeon]